MCHVENAEFDPGHHQARQHPAADMLVGFLHGHLIFKFVSALLHLIEEFNQYRYFECAGHRKERVAVYVQLLSALDVFDGDTDLPIRPSDKALDLCFEAVDPRRRGLILSACAHCRHCQDEQKGADRRSLYG
jgi:hypothetical protein